MPCPDEPLDSVTWMAFTIPQMSLALQPRPYPVQPHTGFAGPRHGHPHSPEFLKPMPFLHPDQVQ